LHQGVADLRADGPPSITPVPCQWAATGFVRSGRPRRWQLRTRLTMSIWFEPRKRCT